MAKQRLKIGVLTYHRCINYGAYWQARYLAEGLRTRGYDAVLIDHSSWRVNMREWKYGLRPHWPRPVPLGDSILYGVKILKFFHAFASLPLSSRVSLDDPSGMDLYDAVVVGSDEVWNLNHAWYGGCPLFFGDGVQARRLASYAASFGGYDAKSGLEQRWVDRLRAFHAISVRDENSWRIVRDALGIEPDLVLDPCLQFTSQTEGRWSGPRIPFVAVYGNNFSETFSRGVRSWANERGYPLVSIGYRNAWADQQWLTAGPNDFVQAMARTEAVATNFFHGCVFALRYEKPFVCEVTSSRNIKVRSLAQMLGAEQRLVPADTQSVPCEATLGTPIDREILEKLDVLREASNAYLDRVLDFK